MIDSMDSSNSGCCKPKTRTDYLLWVSLSIISAGYALHLLMPSLNLPIQFRLFSEAIFNLINSMWWGLAIGIISVGLIAKIPRDIVTAIFGMGDSFSGIIRATLAGILLDLCSHGILLVGARLYERGISAGQLVAFLIASPWNSFSLTIILVSLIGLTWTLIFIIGSVLVAILSGLLYNHFVANKVLPKNPNRFDLTQDYDFKANVKTAWRNTEFNEAFFKSLFEESIIGSKMILRWIFFGVVLASLIQTFMTTDNFQEYFGASLAGLLLTMLAATIIEVCSEGSTPIAADILNRAAAPGNAFAFLMTGVSTDYTEIMTLKETSKSWKFALFLPLVTVPQVLLLGWILNYA